MRIAMAGDHAGFEMKRDLAAILRGQGHDVLDLGTGMFDPDGSPYDSKAMVKVDGNAGDSVTLAGGDWSPVAAPNVPVGYTLYVHDASGAGIFEDAYVLVKNTVTVL